MMNHSKLNHLGHPPEPDRMRRPVRGVILAVAGLTNLFSVSLALGQNAPPPSQPASSQPAASQPMSAPDEPIALEETSQADLDDIGLYDLEVPVVVTAARHEQRIVDVPHAVTVITAEDIRRCGAESVADALRLVPGVDVAALGHQVYAVSPRGVHSFVSRQALVLVDGRQIYDSLFGGTLWGLWPLMLEDIDHIEVIRGPGGVTWGANCINGVINIITKDPRDQRGLTASATGGSRGYHTSYLGYGLEDGRLRMRVSGGYEHSDGFARGGSIIRSMDGDYLSGRFSLHAVYEQNQSDTLTFSLANATTDGGMSPPPMGGLNTRHHSEGRASYLLAKWAHDGGPEGQVDITAYVNESHNSPGLTTLDYDYQQIAWQLRHTFSSGSRHTFTWGIDTRADLINASHCDPQLLSKDHVNTAIVGAYLQDDWELTPRWRLTLGGRIDYEFYGGFQPSGRAALSFHPNDNTRFYAAVASAYQMAPATFRYLDTPLVDGLVRMRANADCNPQRLTAFELGYRGQPTERLLVDVNLFWNEYRDKGLLLPPLRPPRLNEIYQDSGGRPRVYGVELGLRYAVNEQLTLLSNYTYQQESWESEKSFRASESIAAPRHKAMLGVRYSPLDDLHLSAHAWYVHGTESPDPLSPWGMRHIDPYVRLDLRAEYEFWNDRAAVSVGVRNLLDSHHPEGTSTFLNDAEVPRMIYGEFRIHFD